MTPITPPLKQDSFITPSKYKLNVSTDHTALPQQSYLNSPTSPTFTSSPSSNVNVKSKLDLELEKFNNTQLVLLKNFILNPLSYKLRINNLIGIGSFANVLSCQYTTLNNVKETELAIKIPTSSRKISHILKESLFLIELNQSTNKLKMPKSNYPFVKSYGLVTLSKSNYNKIRYGELLPSILLEKLDCNLEEYINNHNNDINLNELYITNKTWWKLCIDLINSLTIMKSCSIIHSDLKSSNILLQRTNSNINFKISDFTSSNFLNFENNHLNTTLEFSSPKLVSNPPSIPTFQTDLYSTGLILLHSAIGNKPYSNITNNNNNNNSIYLINLIQTNSIYKTLSREDLNYLNNDGYASKLLHMILVDECELDDVLVFLESIGVLLD